MRTSSTRRTEPAWPVSDASIVLPIDMARTMWRRAERLDAGLGGEYVAQGNTIQVWCDDHDDAVGAFSVRWQAPTPREATLHGITWDPRRSSEVHVRTALRRLADRIGTPATRRSLFSKRDLGVDASRAG